LFALTILHHHHLPELQWYANALLKYRIFVGVYGAVTTRALNPCMRAVEDVVLQPLLQLLPLIQQRARRRGVGVMTFE
jgi:hypothetical protein